MVKVLDFSYEIINKKKYISQDKELEKSIARLMTFPEILSQVKKAITEICRPENPKIMLTQGGRFLIDHLHS